MLGLDKAMTRRELLARATQTAAGAAAAGAAVAGRSLLPEAAAAASGLSSGRVWDVHVHMTGFNGTAEARVKALLKYADRMGIDRLILFLGFSRDHSPSPAVFRKDNDDLLRGLEAGKGRVFGFVYLNPVYLEESLKELDRCVRDGPMLGVKLWIATPCNDPRLDPIARRAGELKAVVLQHAYWRTFADPKYPGESHPGHVAELAERHPDVSFICAHSGNDWERGIRAIRPFKNVCSETSGFDPTAGMVEMAVRELGVERVIFASDAGGRSYASQMAKVTSADLSDRDRRLILGGNIERLLTPILADKGIKL